MTIQSNVKAEVGERFFSKSWATPPVVATAVAEQRESREILTIELIADIPQSLAEQEQLLVVAPADQQEELAVNLSSQPDEHELEKNLIVGNPIYCQY